ncbi:MAG: UvrD-helicase domain-containing protein [Betaproteobacteria bacterium]|nr:UvrD-helicase domain-containing protein [Betaproteobacteria bacterium]
MGQASPTRTLGPEGTLRPRRGRAGRRQRHCAAPASAPGHPPLPPVDVRAGRDTLATYAAIKKEIGGIDFVDQEQQLLQVLVLPSVKEVIEEELDLLMVDEFQDTSPIQLALFTRLRPSAPAMWVWVGDVKQAIYGFRGSDSEPMSAVIDPLPKAGVVPEVLSRSWRSRPSLVHL